MNIDEYRQMRDKLSVILESLPHLASNVVLPPLLDMEGGVFGKNNEIVGIKNFRISAEKDIDALETVSWDLYVL